MAKRKKRPNPFSKTAKLTGLEPSSVEKLVKAISFHLNVKAGLVLKIMNELGPHQKAILADGDRQYWPSLVLGALNCMRVLGDDPDVAINRVVAHVSKLVATGYPLSEAACQPEEAA